MAKKRFSRVRNVYRKAKRRASKMTLPIAPLAGLGAGLVQPVEVALSGDYRGAAFVLCRAYTGFDPFTNSFKLSNLKQGLLPLLVGVGAHKVAGMVGINRMLAAAKIPLVRV